MKRFIFIVLSVTAILTNLRSQTTFNCSYRQYCYWDESSKIYQNCKGFEEAAVFIVSKDEKMFTYEVLGMKSYFIVKEKEYESKTDTWTYKATSAEGNKFIYTFDPRNKEIRFVPAKEEKSVMHLFTIDSIK